jgi:hypothetical protein
LNTTDLLGGMVIPAQLVSLGVSLLQLKIVGIARSSFLGVFRVAMGVGVGFTIAEVFGLVGAAWAIVIIQSAMPVAVSSYLFAQKYDRKPEEVAGMVVVSTGVSFVTLPLLLMAVLWQG